MIDQKESVRAMLTERTQFCQEAFSGVAERLEMEIKPNRLGRFRYRQTERGSQSLSSLLMSNATCFL